MSEDASQRGTMNNVVGDAIIAELNRILAGNMHLVSLAEIMQAGPSCFDPDLGQWLERVPIESIKQIANMDDAGLRTLASDSTYLEAVIAQWMLQLPVIDRLHKSALLEMHWKGCRYCQNFSELRDAQVGALSALSPLFKGIFLQRR